ncbi:HD-GYP domain-containing protein [Deefgea piscis]|uniref:HD-GYP domain-containing protein n=1 Tax=Deefgea piscis TaxID=2739061 RepID=UPI001C7F9D37|nr:HD-GYP domain-containing protein [Deefgea piscis]QZA82118.1 HD-GYP domain-containing protein [Deefgea piscis]
MAANLKLAELLGSLSYALDLTEGQPEGHCVRCCWIGVHIGRQIGMDEAQIWALYYTLLLKDLGCSSNAARICELYLVDDQHFKHDFKLVGNNLSQVLGFVFEHTGKNENWTQRLTAILNILRNGDQIAQELIQTRCDRGARIARQLRFPEAVAQGIHSLDEHWDGSGRPEGLRGSAIPIHARIALLAQVIDVFNFSHGMEAARLEIQQRAGVWFDPELVAAFNVVGQEPAFWQALNDPNIDQIVQSLEPAQWTQPLDEQYMDDIASAFGQVVDAKSPFTAGHSERVGFYANLIAQEMGFSAERCQWITRAALLHDVGKLGVSSRILEKPGRLTDEEFRAVQQHASLTETILGKIAQFAELAVVAAAHHERLDGQGYPRKISGAAICMETRIITVADIFDTISAERPYHAANSPEKTIEIMRGMLGSAIDADCFAALQSVVMRESMLSPA